MRTIKYFNDGSQHLTKQVKLASYKIYFMKKIIIATDFSPAADNAVEYGTDMALAVNADILLLHVYQPPVVIRNVPLIVDVESIKKSAEKKITQLKDRLRIKVNNKIKINTEERMGTFFHELKTVCERINPYAVVMGSQGTTASDRLFFGSQTIQAMKNLEWPLITVPPSVTFSSIKKIGLACDLDKEIDDALIYEIKTLVNDFNAELHIINAGKKMQFKPGIVFKSIKLEKQLSPVKPKYHFITADNTDEGIIDYAEMYDIDLLITLPKSRSLLELLIQKRVSKKLILRSHIPVISLHQ